MTVLLLVVINQSDEDDSATTFFNFFGMRYFWSRIELVQDGLEEELEAEMMAELDLLLLVDVDLLEEAGGGLLLVEAACLLVDADDTCLEDDFFSGMGQSSLGFFLFSPLFEDNLFDFLHLVSFEASTEDSTALSASFSYTTFITS